MQGHHELKMQDRMHEGAPPVDVARIEDTSGGDRVFERELVELYLEDNEARVARIRALLGVGDPTQLKREAHTLKGSSANVGAIGLSQRALALEGAALRGDLAAAALVVDEVEAELLRVRRFFEAWLARA